jgi:hypothetical protein
MHDGPPASTPDAGLSAPLWVPGHAPDPHRSLAFKSLPEKFGTDHVELANAQGTVDLHDWAAVAMTDTQLQETCTLTLVGPAVVLLAAHCVDAGYPVGTSGNGTIGGMVTFASAKYTLQNCGMPDTYKQFAPNPRGAPRGSADFALCELDRNVSGVPPEVISTSVATPHPTPIRLMGSGCTNLGLNSAGDYTWADGKNQLRMGAVDVDAIAISLWTGLPGIYVRTASGVGKEPQLCFGDSGGPVTIDISAGSKSRNVVAVNSGLGSQPGATASAPAFYSYLAPLNSQDFRDFLKAWVDAGNTGAHPRPRIVCGYNRNAGQQGCRG